MNWRGRPLTSHEVVVQSIAATTTSTGLKVDAVLDDNSYPTGVTISDAQMEYAATPSRSPATPSTPTGTTPCTHSRCPPAAPAATPMRQPHRTPSTALS